MHIGMGLRLTRRSGGVSVPFEPASLFTTEKGFWFDATDTQYLWQDTAGTSAVTTTGQTVQRVDLQYSGGGSGGNLLNAAAAPVWTVEDSVGRLQFNGTTQFLKALAVDMAGASSVTVMLAVKNRTINVGADVMFEHGVSSATAGFGVNINDSQAGHPSLGFGSSSGNRAFTRSPGSISSDIRIICGVLDPSKATVLEKSRMVMDGVAVDEVDLVSAGTPTTAAFASRDLYMGARAGTSLFSNIDVFGGLVIARTLSASEIWSMSEWMATRQGRTLLQYFDTRETKHRGTYVTSAAFSRVVISTTATEITVNSYNDLYATYPQFTSLGVLIDGVYNQTIAMTATGLATDVVTLPSGQKTVELIGGLQVKPTASIFGTYVESISANAAFSVVTPSATNRVLIYGDSISVGANATDPNAEGWGVLLRSAVYPRSVATEGWGSRSLYDDAVDSTARAAFVAIIAAYAPPTIWLAIGTNDYGLNKWSAASFGTAYAALLDDLHTALPSAAIYCQTPILRSTETANGSGSTLGNYRTEIGTAVSTRTSYATLVDGTAFMTTGSLADGIHPTTAGHALYYDAVAAALGV